MHKITGIKLLREPLFWLIFSIFFLCVGNLFSFFFFLLTLILINDFKRKRKTKEKNKNKGSALTFVNGVSSLVSFYFFLLLFIFSKIRYFDIKKVINKNKKVVSRFGINSNIPIVLFSLTNALVRFPWGYASDKL